MREEGETFADSQNRAERTAGVDFLIAEESENGTDAMCRLDSSSRDDVACCFESGHECESTKPADSPDPLDRPINVEIEYFRERSTKVGRHIEGDCLSSELIRKRPDTMT
jgi:hypothetical protein